MPRSTARLARRRAWTTAWACTDRQLRRGNDSSSTRRLMRICDNGLFCDGSRPAMRPSIARRDAADDRRRRWLHGRQLRRGRRHRRQRGERRELRQRPVLRRLGDLRRRARLPGRHWRRASMTACRPARTTAATRPRCRRQHRERRNCDNGLFCDGSETCDARARLPGGHGAERSTTGWPARTTAATRLPTIDRQHSERRELRQRSVLRRLRDLRRGARLPGGHRARGRRRRRLHGRQLRRGRRRDRQRTVNDANCDNGLFCDGSETCDAVARLPGRNSAAGERLRAVHGSTAATRSHRCRAPRTGPHGMRQRPLLRWLRGLRRRCTDCQVPGTPPVDR